jgi:tRNA threonylcarbamoyladenosine biosynthesis protein TsaE
VHVISTTTPEETVRLGEKLGVLLKPGMVVCLLGDLGAGKTKFAQGVACGLGVSRSVTSPTFTLINEYMGRHPLYHMDFYRVDDPLELEDMGYAEYFYGSGITLIEWPERAMELLPEERLEVSIKDAYDREDNFNHREICFKPYGAGYSALLEELMANVRVGD